MLGMHRNEKFVKAEQNETLAKLPNMVFPKSVQPTECISSVNGKWSKELNALESVCNGEVYWSHSRVPLGEVLEGQFDPQLHVFRALQHAGLQVTDVVRLAVEVPLIVLRDTDVSRGPALLEAPVYRERERERRLLRALADGCKGRF